MDGKVQRYPMKLLSPHMHILPYYLRRLPKWCMCNNWWTYTETSLLPQIHSSYKASLLMFCILWLDKLMKPCIHHYSITQVTFTALKTLYPLPIHHCFLTNLCDYWYFYYLHNFSFSEMSHRWNNTICTLFRLTSFILSWDLIYFPFIFLRWKLR